MSTWLLLGGLIVMVIIVGMSLEILENRRIDREAHRASFFIGTGTGDGAGARR
jgi:hypothetical protein